MAHASNWNNWRKPRLERDCMRQTEHPAIPARMDKTCREAVLKMLVSSPFDSRLSVMEHLQGLFALLEVAGANVSATKEAIYHAAELFQTQQGSKRLLRERQRPEKRPKYSPVDVTTPLSNTTKEESALLRLWTKEVRQALVKKNKPLKAWTTRSRLLTLVVQRYKKVVSRAKQNVVNRAKLKKARGQARLNEQSNRKAKCCINDGKRKQVTPCSSHKLSPIDGFIAEIFLAATAKPTQERTKMALKPHDLHKDNNTLQKKGNVTAKPQAKVHPTRAKDEIMPDMAKRVPPLRKRKGGADPNGEPTTSSGLHTVEKKARRDSSPPLQGQHKIPSKKSCSTPQKITWNEPVATQPSHRYKYIKDNENATNSGLLAGWLRPKATATTRPRSPHKQAISTNPTTICLRPQDKWMGMSEYPAEPRTVCFRPQDRWYEKSQPRHASLGPYDRRSNKPGPGFRRPQDKWSC